MDWFERLTGFAETDYATTKDRLRVEGKRLGSSVNGQSYGIGQLELVSLDVLRSRARPLLNGSAPTTIDEARGDVRGMHLWPENSGALVQVASQFNLLEMVGPQVSPEDGVTRYQFDATQGPACAMAAGAATIYRNYFVPTGDAEGQTRDRQINCIDDLGTALGHDIAPLWNYRNGYVLPSAQGLRRIREQLAAVDETQRDVLRGLLKLGIHWDVDVTDAARVPRPVVSQVFCSAMPVAYSDHPTGLWEPVARLVLEAAYEATLLAGVLNSVRPCGSNRVLLTRLGGGAFGNEARWIDQAMQVATRIVANAGLQIVHVVR